jgi:hypothetical protein
MTIVPSHPITIAVPGRYFGGCFTFITIIAFAKLNTNSTPVSEVHLKAVMPFVVFCSKFHNFYLH